MPSAGTGDQESPSFAAYKSIVAYDGTEFEGFQRQTEGRRTVQGELERALRSIGWAGQSLRAAGRTDQGVHALGQVISYRLNWRHAAEDLTRALNANLPHDIAVRRTQKTGLEFHPRFSAVSRRYRYSILIDPVRHPLLERYAWRLETEPDLDVMQASASELLGEHDFGALGTAPVAGGHTRRKVLEAVWMADGTDLTFQIEADAFLYHMVRRIVALLVAIGQEREAPDTMHKALAKPSVVWQGGLAPACGLCLTAVKYGAGDPEYEAIDNSQE
ncbi:MAG: tRNA pseudouridine(38-40) synthase TruA [Anaerolineales bacterium]|jgi:tRNA pseudouridine38-40 synthase